MNDEAEFRKLKWRCRRGMRELDQLFERWLDTRWRAASTEQRDTFLRLLDSEDDRLWRWFLGHETPSDDALRALVDDMRETPPA
jgi:antitoxin CptB